MFTMSSYDEKFPGGCVLTAKTVAFMEGFTAQRGIRFSVKRDIKGKDRVYLHWSETVYGAGNRSWVAARCRQIGVVSDRASELVIQVQAATIAGLNGNRTFAKMVLQHVHQNNGA